MGFPYFYVVDTGKTGTVKGTSNYALQALHGSQGYMALQALYVRYADVEPEMGIYRDKSSAIVIGNNLLPIIVIAQNSLDLSITDIAFVLYFVIADKLSR